MISLFLLNVPANTSFDWSSYSLELKFRESVNKKELLVMKIKPVLKITGIAGYYIL